MKVGLLKIRMFRPFPAKLIVSALNNVKAFCGTTFPIIYEFRDKIKDHKTFKDNGDSDLDYSIQIIEELLGQDRKGSLGNWEKEEQRDDFNQFIIMLVELFRCLKNIILFQYGYGPEIIDNIEFFYGNLFTVIQWKVLLKQCKHKKYFNINNFLSESSLKFTLKSKAPLLYDLISFNSFIISPVFLAYS